jgi:hypothetical protein
MSLVEIYGGGILIGSPVFNGVLFHNRNEKHREFLTAWRDIENKIRDKFTHKQTFEYKNEIVEKIFVEEYEKFFNRKVINHQVYE